MKDGILQQIGTPDEIYRTPINIYVAGFIGSPMMNFIDGRAEGEGAQTRFVFTGGSLELPAPTGRAITLGQRPEHIHLDENAAWRGEVLLLEPTGADTYVVVKTAAGLITVRAPANTKLNIGEHVGMSVSGRHNNWFDKATGIRVEA
jgi:multiple sugar transport system ATP-binding protein